MPGVWSVQSRTRPSQGECPQRAGREPPVRRDLRYTPLKVCVGLAEIGSYVLIGRFPGLVVGCGGDMCPHGRGIVVGPAARAYMVHREHTSGEELIYIAVLALLGMKLPFANQPHRESHVGSMA